MIGKSVLPWLAGVLGLLLLVVTVGVAWQALVPPFPHHYTWAAVDG